MPTIEKTNGGGIPCAGFLSQAGNQSHDVHAKETKLQLMISLHQLFVAERNIATSTESAESAPPDAKELWNNVKKAMLGMKPHFASSMDAAAKFVGTWCARDDDMHLTRAEVYAKTLRDRREPADSQLDFLADANLKRCQRWFFQC